MKTAALPSLPSRQDRVYYVCPLAAEIVSQGLIGQTLRQVSCYSPFDVSACVWGCLGRRRKGPTVLKRQTVFAGDVAGIKCLILCPRTFRDGPSG